ncbi:MAG: hypothetical protein WBH57_07060 [Anaerolineae bacterium]
MNRKTRTVTPNKVGIREINRRMMYLVNGHTPSLRHHRRRAFCGLRPGLLTAAQLLIQLSSSQEATIDLKAAMKGGAGTTRHPLLLSYGARDRAQAWCG